MHATRRAAAIGIALGVCLGARAAPATEAAYYEVAQPMFDERSGCVRVQHVAYQLWVGSSFPGREIDLTCAFGPVVVNPGLRVITREKSFRDSLPVEPWVLDKTVEATVACLLENAGRSEIPIRRLRIRVIGSPRFRRISGVFRIPARIERTFCERPVE